MKDPFGEYPRALFRRRLTLLGATFEFESGSEALLNLVDRAYGGLRPHRLSGKAPRFRVRLQLTEGGRLPVGKEPPMMRTHGGVGLLCGTMDAANFAFVCPKARAAFVGVSRDVLRRFPYHARYELLEFAVFTLASRAQGLMPLHAGGVGLKGNGLLLLGDSGAGKSTLTLLSQSEGLEFLAEDAVFVDPRSLLATGIANFAHLRKDGVGVISDRAMTRTIARSPVIHRRSGIAKYEIDLRHPDFHVAPAPQRISGLVFVSKRKAPGGAVLAPVDHTQAVERLAACQPYASGLPGWRAFTRSLKQVGAFELRRGATPVEGAQALRRLLDWGIKPRQRHRRAPA